MSEITATQAIEAAKGSRGFITTIANRLGVSRQTVYNLMRKYTTFGQAVSDERETLKDFAEGKLLKQIEAENMTAIIFYLKTQAKDRGYIEKIEIEHLLKKELEALLDTLQRELESDVYERILSILAGPGQETA